MKIQRKQPCIWLLKLFCILEKIIKIRSRNFELESAKSGYFFVTQYIAQ